MWRKAQADRLAPSTTHVRAQRRLLTTALIGACLFVQQLHRAEIARLELKQAVGGILQVFRLFTRHCGTRKRIRECNVSFISAAIATIAPGS